MWTLVHNFAKNEGFVGNGGLHRGAGPGWGPVRVGARSGLGPIWALMGPYMGSYGPIWALLGPYGPIWALMGPPGQVLEDYVNFP